MQEGPDFDNPSFYPKAQQQQAATGLKFVNLKIDQIIFQAVFQTIPYWFLLQGLLEVKAGASIGTDISENESARTARRQVF